MKLKKLLPVLITLLLGIVGYYLALPPINLRSGAFYGFLIFLAAVFFISYFILNHLVLSNFSERVIAGKVKEFTTGGGFKGGSRTKKRLKIAVIIVGAVLLTLIIMSIASSRVFRAKAYREQLSVTSHDFAEDMKEIKLEQITVVDRDSAQLLGNSKLGEVEELVSQFTVADTYTQINYLSKPIRVSPLQYSGFIKWMNNRDEGIPYYISVDMTTQETKLITLDEGIKYSPSEYFGRNLKRYVRMKYPTRMFKDFNFEVDDNGHPYWTVSCYSYKIGLFGGQDITSIIAVDAINGNTTEYKVGSVPDWIDRVYSTELCLKQADNWGQLGGGYMNSIFGQKGVVSTSSGYNYLAINNDVWLYTGLTSSDESKSNTAFILINMRTKETKKYAINGADEVSAMESAEGKVQEKGYVSTFPLLITVRNTPTYFLSLKDNAGLIKSYAFVSVTSFTTVGVGDTVALALANYGTALETDKVATDQNSEKIVGYISAITQVVRSGTSEFYISVEGDDNIYIAPLHVNDMLPLLIKGERVIMNVTKRQGTSYDVKQIEKWAADSSTTQSKGVDRITENTAETVIDSTK